MEVIRFFMRRVQTFKLLILGVYDTVLCKSNPNSFMLAPIESVS